MKNRKKKTEWKISIVYYIISVRILYKDIRSLSIWGVLLYTYSVPTQQFKCWEAIIIIILLFWM